MKKLLLSALLIPLLHFPILQSQTLDWELSLAPEFPIPTHTNGFGIIPAGDSDFMAIGTVALPTAIGQHFQIAARVDQDGNEVWMNTYQFSPDSILPILWEEGRAVIEADDGSFLFLGGASLTSPSGRNLLIQSATPDGEILWRKEYNWSFDNPGKTMIQTPDGNYLAGGHIHHLNSRRAMLFQFSPNGDSLWLHTYFDHPGIAEINSIAWAGGNNPGIIGVGALGNDLLIIKTDENGELLWSQTYPFGASAGAYAVVANEDGSILVGGYHNTVAGITPILIKTDGTGNELWTKEPELGNGIISAIRPAGSDAFVATGSSVELYSPLVGGNGFLFKFDEEGTMIWDLILEGMSTQGGDLLYQEDGKILIAGQSAEGMYIAQYSDEVNSAGAWEARSSWRVVPNPATNFVSVFSEQRMEGGLVRFKLYSVAGVLLDQKEWEGSRIDLKLSGYPSGVYFYTIEIGAMIQSVDRLILKK
jgi:hypothetical protein